MRRSLYWFQKDWTLIGVRQGQLINKVVNIREIHAK